ncbi:unnamed protein product [Symbiodinium sp. CCMP2592]|nr:unnamed protein product [Symbiodinium sp. CCMP2592]
MWANPSKELSRLALACRKKTGTWQEAVSFLTAMQGMKEMPDHKAWGALISACAAGQAWPVSLALLEEASSPQQSPPDITAPMADTMMFNDTMAGAMRQKQWPVVLALFQRLRDAPDGMPRPNVATYALALKACEQGDRWPEGFGLLQQMRDVAVHPNTVTYNTFISLCTLANRWADAVAAVQQLHEDALRPTVITYGSLIAACGKGSEATKALKFLQEMEAAKLQPSVPAVTSAIRACEQGGLWQDALRLFERLKAEDGLPPDLRAYNATLSASEKGAKWGEALEVLKELEEGAADSSGRLKVKPPKPDAISYNAIITACGNGLRWDLSLMFLQRLRDATTGVVADVISFNATASACERASQWLRALALLDDLLEDGIQPDVICCNTLIGACATGLNWQLGLAMLQRMPELKVEPEQLSHRAVLLAAARADAWSKALVLQDDMRSASLPLDSACHSTLLMVCQQHDLGPLEEQLLQEISAEGLHGPEAEAFWCAAKAAAAATRAKSADLPRHLELLKTSAETWRPRPARSSSKELELLRYVLLSATPGDVDSVCEMIERFGTDVLQGGPVTGRWLKIAACDKAEVLRKALQDVSWSVDGKILEIGAYCGYSAMRMCQAVPSNVTITSLENEPVHAVVATVMLEFAGLSGRAKVRVGHSEHLLPRLAGNTFQAVFMDSRGSFYDGEVALMEKFDLLASPAVIVADNVLKPGAPIFLWRVTRDAQFQTEIHPVTEFAMPAKDWMSVSTFRPDGPGQPVPPVPPELLELDRMADDMRIQAMRCSRSVPYQDWADFAELMWHPQECWAGRRMGCLV